jgi:hypothetical protein
LKQYIWTNSALLISLRNISANGTGLASNFCLTRRTSIIRNNVHEDELGLFRLPHIYDIVTLLAQHMSEDSAHQKMKPNELCVFMTGLASEAEEFMRLSPKFFFITFVMLEVNVDFPHWNVGQRTQVSVPVILRGGYYYIISGQENIPLYRIHNPKQFFFSTDGQSLLLRMIAHWHGDKEGNMFEMICAQGGSTFSLYCLPNITSGNGWPSELWSKLSEDEIKTIMPFELVHEPIVKTNSKYCVQLVKLDDKKNIVDIKFPEKD